MPNIQMQVDEIAEQFLQNMSSEISVSACDQDTRDLIETLSANTHKAIKDIGKIVAQNFKK